MLSDTDMSSLWNLPGQSLQNLDTSSFFCESHLNLALTCLNSRPLSSILRRQGQSPDSFSTLEEMAARLSAPTISFVSGAISISSRLVSFLFKLLHGGNGMENSNFFQKRSPPAHVETGKLSLEIEVHRDLSQHILHILTPDLSLQRHENIARGLRAMA